MDCPQELSKVLERARTQRLLAGSARRKATERPSAARDTKVVAEESRRVQERRRQKCLKGQERVRRQILQERHVGARVERLQVQ